MKCDHEWIYYEVSTSLYGGTFDIEQAGYCVKCGYDTHGDYLKKENENEKSI